MADNKEKKEKKTKKKRANKRTPLRKDPVDIESLMETIEPAFPEQNRPHLYAIFKSLVNGATLLEACEAVGIDRSTLWRWQKKYPTVQEAINYITATRIEIVEDALYKKAVMGHVTAMIFWLCNRAPHRWRNLNRIEHAVEQKVEHTGQIETTSHIDVGITMNPDFISIISERVEDGRSYAEHIRDRIRAEQVRRAGDNGKPTDGEG